jgi:hypothetical protein
VGFARLGRTKGDHFAGQLIDQQEVLVGMRLLLAAVVRRLRGVILGAWAATLRPSNGPMGGALQCAGAGRASRAGALARSAQARGKTGSR